MDVSVSLYKNIQEVIKTLAKFKVCPQLFLQGGCHSHVALFHWIISREIRSERWWGKRFGNK